MENLRYWFSYAVAHQRSVHVAVHTLVVNEGTMQILMCAVVAKSSPDWVHGQPATERKGTMQILMCCGGKIVSRLGLRPACCGTQRYDANFDMCCGGNVVSRSGFRPACCGTRGYDASFNSCCSGQVCWQIFRRILDCLKMTVNSPVNKNKGILVCQRDGILFCLIFSLFNRYPQF